jgi:hypothetical protein
MESHYRKGKVVGLDCFIYTCEGDQKCEICFVTRESYIQISVLAEVSCLVSVSYVGIGLDAS